ncbi:MAG: glutamate formimidoyltransferase [Saprospiraceae bacterium]|nr:glutamate formimidoyltransferase [Saprospiraceae bacterium]
MKQLLECVPNFSEGRDPEIIRQITDVIESVEGVQLLDVDSGKATNRTVVTFVGEPEPVVNAAFLAIKKAAELIDMSKHTGEHPRMGATDVCPLIPIAGISMEETVAWARKLGERVGRELHLPVYLYEAAATRPERQNLATVRAGEYEGLPEKLEDPTWKPDYGPARFNAKSGATVIGARDFLLAYNINLNTTSVRRANSVAFDVREKGRVLREGDPVTGKIVTDTDGEPVRVPGLLQGVKAIGWFIDEYGIAQISMNITDIRATPLHEAFEACVQRADHRGLRVTGSELVGMAPLQVILDAGRYFLEKQQRSAGVSESELIRMAVKSMGLDELGPFDPHQKIIEYKMGLANDGPLVRRTLRSFADETAAESAAPGGGSISAYVGALGAALGAMVANLSAHKRGWDDRWAEFSAWAQTGQRLKDRLLRLVDEDTAAFDRVMAAFALPKDTDAEKAARSAAIQAATKGAIEVPVQVVQTALEAFPLLRDMVEQGNPNSITDAGVGALCIRTCVLGAALNVRVNAASLKDKDYAGQVIAFVQTAVEEAVKQEGEILALLEKKLGQ